MAKLPLKKGNDNVGDWLNTYADMVTLLLTFFVLLFACSNLDETKLQYVFQEFKSRGRYVNNVVAEQDPTAQENGGNVTDNPDNIGGDGTMPESFEELYTFLADYVDNNNLSESVAVEQGAAHIKIRFDSAVMFEGDSYYLTDEGREVLNGMIPGIKAIQSAISRNTVSGHTSIGTSNMNDWSLSANRAVSVVNYLDRYKTLETSKYRVMGCGPYEPTEEDIPAKNRRVEMLLLKNELDFTDMKVIQDILEHDYNIGSGVFDPENQQQQDPSTLPPGSVDKIVANIKDKFNVGGAVSAGTYGPGSVDGTKFIPTEETSGGDESGGADNTDSGNADDDDATS